MTRQGSGIVTELTITALPAAPLHVFEIWGNPAVVAKRFEAASGFALPAMGRSSGTNALTLIRYEPTIWLVEGDVSPLAEVLGEDGALAAIGGGIVRVLLKGQSWRALLMEGGVFDAENPAFSVGCSAATIIDHVNVHLYVLSEDSCLAYVPLSYSAGLIHFWEEASKTLV
jgi:heterotetrameric sarcosine oxidase gamma subunit